MLKKYAPAFFIVILFIVIFDNRVGVTLRGFQREWRVTDWLRIERLINFWKTQGSGLETLPPEVLSARTLLGDLGASSYTLPEGGYFSTNHFQRISEGLWPIRARKNSTWKVFHKDEKLSENCVLKKSTEDVKVAVCSVN